MTCTMGQVLNITMISGLVAGLLGGIVSFLIEIEYKKVNNTARFMYNDAGLDIENVFTLSFINGCIGICGGVAVVVALYIAGILHPISLADLASDDKTKQLDIKDIVILIGGSLIGGFGARRFLPQIRDQLGNKLNDLGRKYDELDDKHKSLAKNLEETSTELADAKAQLKDAEEFAHATACASPDVSKELRESAIESIKGKLQTYPTARKYIILLGRLYKAGGEYDKGIDALTTFINKKDAANAKDIDLADALFNRACYYALRIKGLPDNNSKQEYTDKALADLERSIKLSASNKANARTDNDFANIRADVKFNALTAP